MAVLLLAEHSDGQIAEASMKALTAVAPLGAEAHVLVAGAGSKAAADHAATLSGVSKVLHLDDAAFSVLLAEPYAALIAEHAGAYEHIVAAATAAGKNIMARVAGLLDVMILSDVTAVESADTFERPIYAGNAIMTVKSSDAKKVITIRTATFAAAEAGGSAAVEAIAAPGAGAGLSEFVSEDTEVTDRPQLTSAKVVVSGGRALGSAENFAIIDKVASALNAAVGASRAAVDSGYAPNDYQVGQTGKVVAPDLYIAVGISGAIQHLAGMKDSKVIVAINKDEEAPIFQVADYGLVADLFDAAPELAAELEKAAG